MAVAHSEDAGTAFPSLLPAAPVGFLRCRKSEEMCEFLNTLSPELMNFVVEDRVCTTKCTGAGAVEQ